ALLEVLFEPGQLLGGLPRILGEVDGLVQGVGDTLEVLLGLVLFLQRLGGVAFLERLCGLLRIVGLDGRRVGGLGRLLSIVIALADRVGEILLLLGQVGQFRLVLLFLRVLLGVEEVTLLLGQLGGLVGQLLGVLGLGGVHRRLEQVALLGQLFQFLGDFLL